MSHSVVFSQVNIHRVLVVCVIDEVVGEMSEDVAIMLALGNRPIGRRLYIPTRLGSCTQVLHISMLRHVNTIVFSVNLCVRPSSSTNCDYKGVDRGIHEVTGTFQTSLHSVGFLREKDFGRCSCFCLERVFFSNQKDLIA